MYIYIYYMLPTTCEYGVSLDFTLVFTVFLLDLRRSSQEVLDNIGLGGPIKHLDTALHRGCWWLCCLDFGFRKKWTKDPSCQNS